MDNTTLRRLPSRELALYLRDAASKQSAEVVSDLLSAIEQEILPSCVFSIWLRATADYAVPLINALRQDYSNYVRKVAILRFGKELRTAHWKSAWDKLGGTLALLAIFAQLSVYEVKALSKVIGRCRRRSKAGLKQRKQQIVQLTQGLLPSLYPESAFKSTDGRPLAKHYAQMVPACTSDFVVKFITNRSHPLFEYIPKQRIVQYHLLYFGSLCLMVCSGHKLKSPLEGVWGRIWSNQCSPDFLPPLLQSVPQVPGTEPKFSASMSFSVEVLKELAASRVSKLPGDLFTFHLVDPLMRRIVTRRLEPYRVQELVNLTITYFRKHPDSAVYMSLLRGSIPFTVTGY